MGFSKIKPLTSQYHSLGGSRTGGGICCIYLISFTYAVYSFIDVILLLRPTGYRWIKIKEINNSKCSYFLVSSPSATEIAFQTSLPLILQLSYKPMANYIINKAQPWTTTYCKTRNFRVPFISRISRPQQIRENNGSRIFERHRNQLFSTSPTEQTQS